MLGAPSQRGCCSCQLHGSLQALLAFTSAPTFSLLPQAGSVTSLLIWDLSFQPKKVQALARNTGVGETLVTVSVTNLGKREQFFTVL